MDGVELNFSTQRVVRPVLCPVHISSLSAKRETLPTAAQNPAGHMFDANVHFFWAICASAMHVMRGHRPGGQSRPWLGTAVAACRSTEPCC